MTISHVTKVRTKDKEKQDMQREQLMSMSKQDLNVALTPYMGGYSKGTLANVTKEKMVQVYKTDRYRLLRKINRE